MSTVKTIAGQLDAKGLKVAVVATRFNDFIVDRLVGGARAQRPSQGPRRLDGGDGARHGELPPARGAVPSSARVLAQR